MNLLKGIARQFTQKTSKITGTTVPENYLISEWKIEDALITYGRSAELISPLISDNLCFRVSHVSVSKNLILKTPEIYDVEEFLVTPISFEFDYTNETVQKLKALEFYEPLKKPIIFEIEVPNDESLRVLVSDFTTLLNEKVICLEQALESFDSIKVFNYEQLDNSRVRISENLLNELATPNVSGKHFGRGTGSYRISDGSSRDAKSGNHTIFPDVVNEWDLLQPILLPPLSLEFPKKLDFYSALRGYQKQGIRWLVDNHSALLADEMGTGKTVQAVTALRLLFRQGKLKSALIVCPPAVIGSVDITIETNKSEGWSGHFHHWAPELRIVTLHGKSPSERRLLWESPSHVYITTYSTLRTDIYSGSLEQRDRFTCVVLDESQKIKNRETRTAKVVCELKPLYRWALTGTPVENKLADVQSLFDFVLPGLFKSTSKESMQIVKKKLEPYMLRRLKEDVLQELPDKIKQEEWLDLDSRQREDYERILKSVQSSIKSSLASSHKGGVHIFSKLTKLKQLCNFSEGSLRSPKADLLLDYVRTIASNKKKVLIFSQYKKEGTEKIYRLLQEKSIGAVLYTGDVSKRQKDKVVKDFRSDPNITAFIATTTTAGYGITLTEATYVIHFDYLWNPAVMQNAEDRTHRIGQKSSVTVYSFWMKGTIEERIKKKISEKRLLIDSTVNELAVEEIDRSFSTEDWLEILDIGSTTAQESVTEKISGMVSEQPLTTYESSQKSKSSAESTSQPNTYKEMNVNQNQTSNDRLRTLEDHLRMLRKDIGGRERSKILAPFEEEARIEMQIQQRRKQMRPFEEEYWQLLTMQAKQAQIVDSEAEILIAEIVEQTAQLQTSSQYPKEITEMLQKIYVEVSKPDSPAASKLKGAVSLVPPFISLGYEAEIDTGNLFSTRFPSFTKWCKSLVRK